MTISSDKLPAFPSDASDYLKKGAGAGPGLQGKGSQTSGSSTTQLADAGSGAVTSGAAAASGTSSKGAAANVQVPALGLAPFVCGFIVVASTLFGAALI